MTARFPFALHAAMLSLAILGLSAEASGGQNVFSVFGDRVLFNGQPFKVIGLRLANGLVSDTKTQELIDNLDVFRSYGVNTVSVFIMGSRFVDIKGYGADASLDATYSARDEAIGLYTPAMKTLNINDATNDINNNAGYMLASTWLQAGSGAGINGPFMSPGGYSNVADVNANLMVVNADAGG